MAQTEYGFAYGQTEGAQIDAQIALDRTRKTLTAWENEARLLAQYYTQRADDAAALKQEVSAARRLLRAAGIRATQVLQSAPTTMGIWR